MSIGEETRPDNFEDEQNYRSFLLRCWQEEEAGPDGEPTWHFTLVHFNQEQIKKGFPCLEALMAYLRTELRCAH